MSAPPLRVGIVGCGEVSAWYVEPAPRFPELALTACADRDAARARTLAGAADGIEHRTVAELLASEDVDAVLNLTPAAAHAEVSLAAIAHCKHVYSEKPLAAAAADGAAILRAAGAAGVRVGCAPDTFLGAGLQTGLRLVREGAIGRPVSAQVTFQSAGPDRLWHASPEHFYAPGGGPLLDMGPYFLAPLVLALGPIARVAGFARTLDAERTIRFGERTGTTFPVATPSHVMALLSFASGPVLAATLSFDVPAAEDVFVLHGTEGSIALPGDSFGGPLRLRDARDAGSAREPRWRDVELDSGPTEQSRGLGLAEMARAIAEQRPHRASGELALHVLEAMEGVLASAAEGRVVDVRPSTTIPFVG